MTSKQHGSRVTHLIFPPEAKGGLLEEKAVQSRGPKAERKAGPENGPW